MGTFGVEAGVGVGLRAGVRVGVGVGIAVAQSLGRSVPHPCATTKKGGMAPQAPKEIFSFILRSAEN